MIIIQRLAKWCRFILGLPIEGAMTAPIERSIRGARDLGEQFEEDTNTQQRLQRARNASQVARTTILSGDVTLQQAEQLLQIVAESLVIKSDPDMLKIKQVVMLEKMVMSSLT